MYIWYVAWRFLNTANKKNSVSGEISGIISLYNSYNLKKKIDRKEFGTLRKVFKGFASFPERQSEMTFPIRNYDLNIMISKYTTTSFNNTMWIAMHCFAKAFALRCSEYAMKSKFPTKATVFWKAIQFFKKPTTGNMYIQFTLKWSKTNHIYKEEILTKRCICDTKYKNICAFHAMYNYFNLCRINLDANDSSIVFRFQNGKPVTCDEFRREFDSSLRFINITPSYPKWRANSLRHGEISDQIAAGIGLKHVQKFCRHVQGSKSTWIYTHLSGVEEADNRHVYEKKFMSNC